MRGLSQPTGAMIAPQVNGWTKKADAALALRRRRREEAARRGRLSERLRGRLRLPEQPLHQRRGDLPGGDGDVGARSASRRKLRTLPLATYFPMIQRYEASIYMLGWGVPTFDALYTLQSLVRSRRRAAATATTTSALQQPADGRADRPHQDRDRPDDAQRADRAGAAAAATRTCRTSRCTTR